MGYEGACPDPGAAAVVVEEVHGGEIVVAVEGWRVGRVKDRMDVLMGLTEHSFLEDLHLVIEARLFPLW